MRTLLLLLLTGAFIFAGEPTREAGLSVHMLPDRVAKIGGGQGGFSVTDPVSRKRETFSDLQKLMAYVERLAPGIRQNGIWIVTTDPTSYSEAENERFKELVAMCTKKNIPVFTCRGMDLSKGGWVRAQ